MSTLRGLKGRNAIVTGGAKGQGFSHVLALADAGCDIAVLDVVAPVEGAYPLATAEMMEATITAVEERGVRCLGLPCDVRDEAQVEAAVSKALAFFDGRIDILVNNAAVGLAGSIQEIRVEDIDLVLDTNVRGPILVTKYVAPAMIAARFGKIINISSGVTAAGVANLSPYVASKYAVNGLTSAWAMELAEFGINVNAVSPPTIRPGDGQGSGMLTALAGQFGMTPQEAYEELSSQQNMPGPKWRGESRHISDAVVFLASDNADQITGQVLAADSGMSAR
ncbi:SDR family oxidoreductase [Nocardioides sp. QY071]|uniref:SDR family NAD(P)-dependent oxidoreductase n=1 Tax=Nocardioides sp. QY071 TaxID=3044187 RepID=UPI00249BEB70|nr:SDR family NAD(P)-dependent oxidoreductase [Nocardioides sp. QY071]WGY00478.1 SDR family oxidoreductase [Nocardioides sp. QY071]